MTDQKTTTEKLRSLAREREVESGTYVNVKTPTRASYWIAACLSGMLIAFLVGQKFPTLAKKPFTTLEPQFAQLPTQTTPVETEIGNANSIRASGFVYPSRQSTVSSQITGRIKDLLVSEGELVQKGQILATLEDDLALANVRESETNLKVVRASTSAIRAELDFAMKNLERLETLETDGYVSEIDLNATSNEIDILRARLNAARFSEEASSIRLQIAHENLKLHSIRSPFEGVVLSVDAQAGEIISPFSAGGGFTRTGICTIVDVSNPFIRVDIPEALIGSIQSVSNVTISLPSNTQATYIGRISQVMPIADRNRASISVRIEFDAADSFVIPGTSATVFFEVERI